MNVTVNSKLWKCPLSFVPLITSEENVELPKRGMIDISIYLLAHRNNLWNVDNETPLVRATWQRLMLGIKYFVFPYYNIYRTENVSESLV